MTIEETYLRIVEELILWYDKSEAKQLAKILLADNYGISNWRKEGEWEAHEAIQRDHKERAPFN